MKLTKEECERALTIFGQLIFTSSQETLKPSECEEYRIFEQLINEHFDNIPLIEFEKFLEASEKYKNEPLKPSLALYEVEKVKRLEKALDKACDLLVELDEITVSKRESYCWNKAEWKEYLLNER